MTNPRGEPLPGVSVAVAGTSLGVATDAAGTFRLEVPNSTDSLTFSYTEYSTQRVSVLGEGPLQVTLQPVAYGPEFGAKPGVLGRSAGSLRNV